MRHLKRSYFQAILNDYFKIRKFELLLLFLVKSPVIKKFLVP